MFAAIMAISAAAATPAGAARARATVASAAAVADAMAPREVQRAARAAALERERHPRHAARGEVRAHHRAQRPALEVRAAHRRVQGDPRAGGAQAHAELDVLDRRPLEAPLVEAAGGVERLAADRAEAGPERLGRTGRARVDVVVQEVAKARDELRRGGVGVVGAEDRVEAGVGVEARAQDGAARRGGPRRRRRRTRRSSPPPRATPALRAAAGPLPRGVVDDLDLVRLVAARERGEAARQRRRVIGCGDDDGEHVRRA